jgi:hypothetical protein
MKTKASKPMSQPQTELQASTSWGTVSAGHSEAQERNKNHASN